MYSILNIVSSKKKQQNTTNNAIFLIEGEMAIQQVILGCITYEVYIIDNIINHFPLTIWSYSIIFQTEFLPARLLLLSVI